MKLFNGYIAKVKNQDFYVSRTTKSYCIAKSPSIIMHWNESVHDRIYDDLRDAHPGLELEIREVVIVDVDKVSGSITMPPEVKDE